MRITNSLILIRTSISINFVLSITQELIKMQLTRAKIEFKRLESTLTVAFGGKR